MIKNKMSRILLSILYLIISYSFFIIGCKKLYFVNFSYNLLTIYTIFNIFVLLHLFININKIYDFIYRKRYIIGLIILALLVIGKYNGSSVELWNDYVEPEYRLDTNVILGVTRPIRSDEWLVSTPTILTQATEDVNFSSTNNILSAKDNLVNLFPKLPCRDISIIASPNYVGYLFLDVERAFSLAWYLPYFILFFATFELLMILTKKKKLYSLVGAIMIVLSPVVQWWQSANIMAYGALAITLFYYLINSNNFKKKLLLSLLFGYSGFLYIMCMYPAWQVPYGYVYLILLIWIIVNNKEKIHKLDFLYLIPILIVIALPIYIIFSQNYDVLTIVNSTVYPGARMSTGGGEWRTLFTYVLDIFYPYKRGLSNPCEFSQYLSLYPIPIFYSIYLMIKNKKKDLFLILSNIVLICLSIWVMFPLPSIISRLTLIYMSTEARAQVAIGYLSVIQIIYILTNYEIMKKEKYLFNIKNLIIAIISIISIFITIKISNNVVEQTFPGYVNLYTSITSLIIFSIIVFLFIYNHNKTNYILSILLIAISLISGIIVSPINKGLSIMYDKPLAKEIRKLVEEDNNSIFIASDSGLILANYIAVNGAKTINTTNQVPNLELYYKLDPELKYDHIYNRYHHLGVNLINENTNFELNQPDAITLNLNYNDLCKIGVDYIVSNNQDISLYDKYDKIYGEYGVNIYKTNCKEY